MSQFERAIIRDLPDSYADGLTPGNFGMADVNLAREQHRKYKETLEKLGLEITRLPKENAFPDSCFVEDPAIVTERVAILNNLGAPTRKGEAALILPALQKIYGTHIERIEAPGTVEGGDICEAGNHFFIGLSRRTNEEGAYQLAKILEKYGYTSSIISIRSFPNILHLKTGLTYLGDKLMICHSLIANDCGLDDYRKLIVKDEEEYASNCILVNGTVIMPKGFDDAIRQVKEAGYNVAELEMSEFMKQDGGLSCLSLRIPRLAF